MVTNKKDNSVTTASMYVSAGSSYADLSPHKTPTLVEILTKQRDEKIVLAGNLDREIQKLDEDILFLQRHPGSDRILTRIAGRLANDALQAVASTEEPKAKAAGSGV